MFADAAVKKNNMAETKNQGTSNQKKQHKTKQ
jgi:hypothetical protein